MTEQAQKAPRLAALLHRHGDEIAAAWAEMAHNLPGTRYREHPLDEIQAWLSPGIAAVVETLTTGSCQATEAHLRCVSRNRLEMGFDISEVLEELLLFKEAAFPIIWRAYPAGSTELVESVAHLNACLRFMTGCLGHLYTEAMEAELRESEERFRTMADFTYDWEYWRSADGTYIYVSPSCERITGYRADEFLKDPNLLETIIHPDDRAVVGRHLREEPLEDGGVLPVDFRVITRGGEERWLEHSCQPVYSADGNYLGRRASNRDVTERRRAEEALEQQAKEKAVAAERSRLARELHDSVTQALYSVTLYAEATRMAVSAGKHDVALENLHELHNMAREAMIDMRVLIFGLHPPALEEEGLVAALQTRLATVESRAGLRTEIRVEGERHLPLLVEEELFWIALEAFNNVVKHARAQQLRVNLRFDDQGVCLEIADDGLGFDPAMAGESGGMGLHGIEERVQRIKGQLEITSAPGQGTTLKVKAEI
jgi:PAS domain S-box-containing protein